MYGQGRSINEKENKLILENNIIPTDIYEKIDSKKIDILDKNKHNGKNFMLYHNIDEIIDTNIPNIISMIGNKFRYTQSQRKKETKSKKYKLIYIF